MGLAPRTRRLMSAPKNFILGTWMSMPGFGGIVLEGDCDWGSSVACACRADAAPERVAARAALVRRKSLLVVFDIGVACSDPALGWKNWVQSHGQMSKSACVGRAFYSLALAAQNGGVCNRHHRGL